MSMPEAAIDKNGFSSRRKYDVRLARQVASIKAESISQRVEQTSHYQFRCGVLSTNPGHQGAAALRGSVVYHDSAIRACEPELRARHYDKESTTKRKMLPKKLSEKPKVIEHLFELYERGDIPEGIVTNSHVQQAIFATEANLSTANPANFIKDVIRGNSANATWPASLKSKRISARQRYGGTRVFQFVQYAEGQQEPFPDRFPPGDATNIYRVQSASMPFAARRLGRREETWLTQIVVNLRLIETQLSIYSPQLRSRVRDITHLQMGLKTQPEIDAVFLATLDPTKKRTSATDLHMLITCEAKQFGQRILEDQIREQIAKAMEITRKLKSPTIDAVKPMAIRVVKHNFSSATERAIHIVEFEHINRARYDDEWANSPADQERLYYLPLMPVSDTIYRVMPRISGLNA